MFLVHFIAYFRQKSPVDTNQWTWEEINYKYGTNQSNVLSLVDLVLTLPAHSADCERGFSRLNYVKNDWRSRLGNVAVSDLLYIMLHTPDVKQFDPFPAIRLWNSTAKRRIRAPVVTAAAPSAMEVEEMNEGT